MTIESLISQLEALPPALEGEVDPFAALKKEEFKNASTDDLLLIAECIAPPDYDPDRIWPLALHAARILILRQEMDLEHYMTLWDENIGEDDHEELLTDLTWCITQLGDKGINEALSIIGNDRYDDHFQMILVDAVVYARSAMPSGIDVYARFANQLKELRPEREINALMIASLIEHCPDRFHDEILAVYDSNVVDVSMNGDREEVEINLGLREKRSTKKPNYYALEGKLKRAFLRSELGEFDPEASATARVDYFLTLYRSPLGAQSAEMLDGVYAVILGAQDLIRPAFLATLPWNLESTEPTVEVDFENQKDTEDCHSALMDFYNSINTTLQTGQYFPSLPLYPDESGNNTIVDIEQWLEGIQRTTLWLETYQGSGPYTQALLEAHDDVLGNQFMDTFMSLDEAKHRLDPIISVMLSSRKGANFNPPTFTSPLPKQVEPKIGRNSPCPCGSGKKFKRCCAN